MHYTIIVVGKTKDPHWAALEDHYLKRLKPFVAIQYEVVKPATQDGALTESQVKQKEAESILKKIPKNSTLIVCDENGTQFSSKDFAQKLQSVHEATGGNCCFVIGGTFGLDQSVLEKADIVWSLSSLTFTHEQARVIMQEQLYRAHMIIAGRAYHY